MHEPIPCLSFALSLSSSFVLPSLLFIFVYAIIAANLCPLTQHQPATPQASNANAASASKLGEVGNIGSTFLESLSV